MQKIINYRTAFRQIDDFIQGYNQDKPLKKDQLGLPEMVLSKELVKIYSAFLSKTAKTSKHSDKAVTLRTNNVQLSKRLHRSTRSVKRYMVKLQAAGFITNKIFHGSNSSYEVQLNDHFLFPVTRLENPFDATGITFSSKSEDTPPPNFYNLQNCPHTETFHHNNISESTEINKIIYHPPVEKTEISSQNVKNKDFKTLSIDEKYGENAKIVPKNEDFTAENCENGPDKQNVAQKAEPVHNPPNLAHIPDFGENFAKKDKNLVVPPKYSLSSNKQFLVSMLWLTASRLLYSNLELTDRQISKGKDGIADFYRDVPEKMTREVHNRFVRAIIQTRQYVNRSNRKRLNDKKRFVLMPEQYFDIKNPWGFTGAIEWDKKWQVNKIAITNERKFKRALAKYYGQLSKGVVGPIEAMRKAEQAIGKLHDPVLMQRFYEIILQHKTLDVNAQKLLG